MNLYALLKVLDVDQIIQVECNHKTVFKGKPDDFENGLIFERMEVKCIWYSNLYKALMVEI